MAEGLLLLSFVFGIGIGIGCAIAGRRKPDVETQLDAMRRVIDELERRLRDWAAYSADTQRMLQESQARCDALLSQNARLQERCVMMAKRLEGRM